jgi:hypothetical protein
MYISVPDIEGGCCLGPEGNGVSSGEGGEGGPAPQEAGLISCQCSASAGTRGQGHGGLDKSVMMKEDPGEQSE